MNNEEPDNVYCACCFYLRPPPASIIPLSEIREETPLDKNTSSTSFASLCPLSENGALFRKCIHAINNMDKLDDEMINNIRNMSIHLHLLLSVANSGNTRNEDKMHIIIAYNKVVENLKLFIDTILVST